MAAFASGLMSGMASGITGRKKKDSGPATESYSSSEGGNVGGGDTADAMGYKRGGKVRKTGPAKVHKGERVLTKAQAKRYEKDKRRKRGSK